MSFYLYSRKRSHLVIPTKISNLTDIQLLFTGNAQNITQRVDQSIKDAKTSIDAILAINHHELTFENTFHALDILQSQSPFAVMDNVIGILKLVSPDENIRTTCEKELLKIAEFSLEHIDNNKALYHALKAYAEGNAKKETLTEEEQYFITKTLQDFKRHGLELPEEQLNLIRKLQQQITQLSLKFETNIATDNRTIAVSHQDLEGLDEDFIKNLKKTSDGQYIIGIDYPTYFNVMKHCQQESTRKALYKAFTNRAYPVNDQLLRDIIKLRDDLAHILGFNNYAELNMAETMAENPSVAKNFLEELIKKAQIKSDTDFARLIEQLPPSVHLTKDNKMNPWDLEFAKTWYEHHHFNLDEREIAQYFPMEKTIEGLIKIYEQFFNLEFKIIPSRGLWHPDIQLLLITDRLKKQDLGYLLLDLYPRPNKFSHACQTSVIEALHGDHTSLNIIIANFTPSTKSKPSLLNRTDVETFFHEFGHCIHSMLGKTRVASFAGLRVKFDFIEVPSQMFEQWLLDKNILHKISSHYTTGEPLPEHIVDTIITVKNLTSGIELINTAYLSLLSLEYYSQPSPNLQRTMKELHDRLPMHILFDDDNHRYASFCHLIDYAARYYSYLWSKVIALDLFNYIKQQGLTDPEVGSRFASMILRKGGSKDPNTLLKEYLGREPNQDAFLKDLGLKSR